jgi:hypothetical protein
MMGSTNYEVYLCIENFEGGSIVVAPLIAIVGDINPERVFDPPMIDPAKAKRAAQEIGAQLARKGARLLVYGGPFLEADVVHGFVSSKPAKDQCILMWYSKENEPPAFVEEKDHSKLFVRRVERGAEWETAFYRSIVRADGVVLIGGGNATNISGQLAIGKRMAILSLPEFGGAANKVWNTLSAGEDAPIRQEIDLMALPWVDGHGIACVEALFAQHNRRRSTEGAPSPILLIAAGLLFLAAVAVVPWVWGQNALQVWMLFLAPMLAGGAGAAIRSVFDRLRGTEDVAPAILATLVLGLVAGGIAGLLFITAQLTAEPHLADSQQTVVPYALRTIPYAVTVGFIAGLTMEGVFGRLLGLDVVRTSGISNKQTQS